MTVAAAAAAAGIASSHSADAPPSLPRAAPRAGTIKCVYPELLQPDDSARIRLALDECGYAVVPVLSGTEVVQYENKIYNVLRSVRPDSALGYQFTPHGAHSQGFVPALR